HSPPPSHHTLSYTTLFRSPPCALDAAHKRRSGNHQPTHEHGHRAFSRGDCCALDCCSTTHSSYLRKLYRAGRDESAGSAGCWFYPRAVEDGKGIEGSRQFTLKT